MLATSIPADIRVLLEDIQSGIASVAANAYDFNGHQSRVVSKLQHHKL